MQLKYHQMNTQRQFRTQDVNIKNGVVSIMGRGQLVRRHLTPKANVDREELQFVI